MGQGGKEPEGRREKEAEGRRDTGDKRWWMKGGKSEKKDKRRRMLDWRIWKRDKKEGRAWGEKSEGISVEEKEERQKTRDKRRGMQTIRRG
jgi:hypothetical protein